MSFMPGQRPIAATIEPAPAKINLGLHVTGKSDNGYHQLDMLICFTKLGDMIHIRPAREDGFSIQGPFAAALEGENASNLVTRARDILREHLEANHALTTPVHILLQKNLPIASGIGGGSADAAATLRALLRHWDVVMSEDELISLALPLGADVPMCLVSEPLIAKGIGEEITKLAHMPQMHLLLVNPLKGVSTPQVFKALTRKDNATMPEVCDEAGFDWMGHIASLRNDLQDPAIEALPEIALMLEALQASGASLARMSGSGATCYGLFDSYEGCTQAATQLKAQHPHWFIAATQTLER
jgi:4-diphosphocytidyl-2-C-methyl-D-erythritol kinase